jgi:hypothetical protein
MSPEVSTRSISMTGSPSGLDKAKPKRPLSYSCPAPTRRLQSFTIRAVHEALRPLS